MRHPLTLAVTLALCAPAFAQQAGTVQDVTVTGTTDLLANFVRASLNVQPGAALSSVNLRQIEQDVVATGYFKSAVAELRTVSGRDVLNIAVVPNPTISAVEATGLTFLPGDQFKSSIAELLNIAPGATLNTQRIDQAKEALAENYRQQGFPFAPSISSEAKTNADGTVTVNFVVDETAPSSRIEATSASEDDALAAAEKGFRVWRRTAPSERAEVLRRASRLMRERIDAIACAITLEHGKPLAQARLEVIRGCEFLECDAGEAVRTYCLVIPSAQGTRYTVHHQPVGTVAV